MGHCSDLVMDKNDIRRMKKARKGKGKGAGFKSWSHADSHDFTVLRRGAREWEIKNRKKIM